MREEEMSLVPQPGAEKGTFLVRFWKNLIL